MLRLLYTYTFLFPSLCLSFSLSHTQNILGISVFSLMLLPLVLSCDSNRTMREIVEDYETVISLLLQNLVSNMMDKEFSCCH